MRKMLAILGIVVLIVTTVVSAWWLIRGGAPISAQEAVERACEAMVAAGYDVAYTAVNTEGTLTIEVRVSGGNRHEVYTGKTTDGTIVARGEIIRKDGVMYSRENIEDTPNTLGNWEIVGRNMSSVEPLPCFAPETFVDGRPQGSSSSERHYSSTSTQPELPGESVLRELWVNVDGRPVRGRTTYTYDVSDGSEVSGASSGTADETPSRVVVDEVYSGFGETNVITAPTLPTPTPTPVDEPTPTPTSTPTATPTATPTPTPTATPTAAPAPPPGPVSGQ